MVDLEMLILSQFQTDSFLFFKTGDDLPQEWQISQKTDYSLRLLIMHKSRVLTLGETDVIKHNVSFIETVLRILFTINYFTDCLI